MKILKNKKGIELSLNMIVTIIISIILLFTAFFAFNQFMPKEEDLILKYSTAEENNAIKDLESSGSKVGLSSQLIETKYKRAGKTVLVIKNIYDEEYEFLVNCSFFSLEDNEGNIIEKEDINEPDKWFSREQIRQIAPKQTTTIPIPIIPYERGKFEININVYTRVDSSEEYKHYGTKSILVSSR
jgi:hypothetical protein